MKNKGGNNLRKDGFYSTSKVHIQEDGKVLPLKIKEVNGKVEYYLKSTGEKVDRKQTCFKSEVSNGRVVKDISEEEVGYDFDYNQNDNKNESYFQDSNGKWQHTADGW